MARFAILAFAIFTFMAGLSVFNEINDCYCGVLCEGNITYTHCYTEYGYWGTGKRLVNYRIEPMIKLDTMVVNEKGESLNASSGDLNETLSGLIAYKSPGLESLDFGSFFSFGLNGLRIMINTFFLPLVGFPDFLGGLGIPGFIIVPVFTFIFILMVIGVAEFVTGKLGWF